MEIKIHSDKKINKISKVLTGFANRHNLKFCHAGEDYPSNEVFSANGFLLLFLAAAKQDYEKLANGLYTHKELMESLNSGGKPRVRKLSVDQARQEEEYLASKNITYRFPVVFVSKPGTYLSAVPFVDPKRKFSMLSMAAFTVNTMLDYAKTYENDKSLLIDGMIPLEGLFERVHLDIESKRVKVLPVSMLKDFEKGSDAYFDDTKDNHLKQAQKIEDSTKNPQVMEDLTEIDFEAKVNALLSGH